MNIPITHYVSNSEFEGKNDIYKIIKHDVNHYCLYFEINSKKYYIGYFSPVVNVTFLILEKEDYLLIGIDLKVVILSIKTGSILFSIGLSSFFKGFENTDEYVFTIFSELNDYRINKNGLSISQIIPHELEF